MRVTIKQLESQVKYLNELTGQPLKPYTFKKGANVGCYYIQASYGGYQLEQIVNKGGGCRTLLNTGYTTKKELYDLISSMIEGIKIGKNCIIRNL